MSDAIFGAIVDGTRSRRAVVAMSPTLLVIGLALLTSSSSLRAQSSASPSGAEVAAGYDPKQDRPKNQRWLRELVRFVKPEYPFIAWETKLDGNGLFRLSIDLNTGFVSAVNVRKSTGYKVLDDSAVAALRQWRLKPHTSHEIDVPVNFRFYRRH
jgi:TonB family protein